MIRSKVAAVSRLIGFMLRLPQSLNHMSRRISVLSTQSNPDRRSHLASRATRPTGPIVGFADDETTAGTVADDAGRLHGARHIDAADHAARGNRAGDDAVRIDRCQPLPGEDALG